MSLPMWGVALSPLAGCAALGVQYWYGMQWRRALLGLMQPSRRVEMWAGMLPANAFPTCVDSGGARWRAPAEAHRPLTTFTIHTVPRGAPTTCFAVPQCARGATAFPAWQPACVLNVTLAVLQHQGNSYQRQQGMCKNVASYNASVGQ